MKSPHPRKKRKPPHAHKGGHTPHPGGKGGKGGHGGGKGGGKPHHRRNIVPVPPVVVPVHPHHPHHPHHRLGEAACCAVDALAASLQLAGVTVPPGAALALHRTLAASTGAGVTLPDALAAAARYGLAGMAPDFTPTDIAAPGVILGFELSTAQRTQRVWDWVDAPYWGPHAVTVCAGGVITWGQVVPVTASFLARACEAWAVTWHVQA